MYQQQVCNHVHVYEASEQMWGQVKKLVNKTG